MTSTTTTSGPEVHATWEPVEIALSANETVENPYTDVTVTATFEHESGETYRIEGFWDGDTTWKIRFSPPTPGTWTWTAESEPEGLGLERRGTFEASEYEGSNPIKRHGFLTVAENDRALTHADGTPFFWLGDTVWAAGAKASPDEWGQYLRTRCQQGFNVAQLNALPQWDASKPQNRLPFGETWDFEKPDPAYFRAFDDLVELTHDYGVVPALVALWFNYVPDTNPDWEDSPRWPIEADQAERYGRYLGARYGAYGAVWLVSGDTDFTETSIDVYSAAADGIRQNSTHPLCTAHLRGRTVTDERINETDWLDFHMFQSGHTVSGVDVAVRLAEGCADLEPCRPAVNGEPCYERHQFFDDEIRISREEARQVAWTSVLAGANAGITYGGHGLWQWHRSGDWFSRADMIGMPLPWGEALDYPGVADYALLKSIFERRSFGSFEANQDVLVDAPEQARAAVSSADGTLVVYTPEAASLTLDTSTVNDDASVSWVDPATGRRTSARIDRNGSNLTVESPNWSGDAVFISE